MNHERLDLAHLRPKEDLFHNMPVRLSPPVRFEPSPPPVPPKSPTEKIAQRQRFQRAVRRAQREAAREPSQRWEPETELTLSEDNSAGQRWDAARELAKKWETARGSADVPIPPRSSKRVVRSLLATSYTAEDHDVVKEQIVLVNERHSEQVPVTLQVPLKDEQLKDVSVKQEVNHEQHRDLPKNDTLQELIPITLEVTPKTNTPAKAQVPSKDNTQAKLPVPPKDNTPAKLQVPLKDNPVILQSPPKNNTPAKLRSPERIGTSMRIQSPEKEQIQAKKQIPLMKVPAKLRVTSKEEVPLNFSPGKESVLAKELIPVIEKEMHNQPVPVKEQPSSIEPTAAKESAPLKMQKLLDQIPTKEQKQGSSPKQVQNLQSPKLRSPSKHKSPGKSTSQHSSPMIDVKYVGGLKDFSGILGEPSTDFNVIIRSPIKDFSGLIADPIEPSDDFNTIIRSPIKDFSRIIAGPIEVKEITKADLVKKDLPLTPLGEPIKFKLAPELPPKSPAKKQSVEIKDTHTAIEAKDLKLEPLKIDFDREPAASSNITDIANITSDTYDSVEVATVQPKDSTKGKAAKNYKSTLLRKFSFRKRVAKTAGTKPSTPLTAPLGLNRYSVAFVDDSDVVLPTTFGYRVDDEKINQKLIKDLERENRAATEANKENLLVTPTQTSSQANSQTEILSGASSTRKRMSLNNSKNGSRTSLRSSRFFDNAEGRRFSIMERQENKLDKQLLVRSSSMRSSSNNSRSPKRKLSRSVSERRASKDFEENLRKGHSRKQSLDSSYNMNKLGKDLREMQIQNEKDKVKKFFKELPKAPTTNIMKVKIHVEIYRSSPDEYESEVIAFRMKKDKLRNLNELNNLIIFRLLELKQDLNMNSLRLLMFFKDKNLKPIVMKSSVDAKDRGGEMPFYFNDMGLLFDYVMLKDKLYVRAQV